MTPLMFLSYECEDDYLNFPELKINRIITKLLEYKADLSLTKKTALQIAIQNNNSLVMFMYYNFINVFSHSLVNN